MAAGLLVGCGSNSEDTKDDYTIQAEHDTSVQEIVIYLFLVTNTPTEPKLPQTGNNLNL